MSRNTAIAWADDTWNLVHGCTKVSPGCEHCYALAMAWRHVNNPKSPFYRSGTAEKRGGKVVWTGKIAVNENALTQPLRWKKPRRIFVNSMSDLFHENMPVEVIDRCFAVMAMADQHTFLVLTKRPERMRAYFLDRAADDYPWAEAANAIADMIEMQDHPWVAESGDLPLPNLWLGVTAEDQAHADARVPILLDTPAAKRFVSHEPALGPVDWTAINNTQSLAEGQRYINALKGYAWVEDGAYYDVCSIGGKIDQIITGGESGPGARRFDVNWARQDRDQCRAAGVAFFMKQMGAHAVDEVNGIAGHATIVPEEVPNVHRLRHRAGADPSEWPADLRVQEFPA